MDLRFQLQMQGSLPWGQEELGWKHFNNLHILFSLEAILFFCQNPSESFPGLQYLMTAWAGCIRALQTGRCFHEACLWEDTLQMTQFSVSRAGTAMLHQTLPWNTISSDESVIATRGIQSLPLLALSSTRATNSQLRARVKSQRVHITQSPLFWYHRD